jgi:hypothetical protein
LSGIPGRKWAISGKSPRAVPIWRTEAPWAERYSLLSAFIPSCDRSPVVRHPCNTRRRRCTWTHLVKRQAASASARVGDDLLGECHIPVTGSSGRIGHSSGRLTQPLIRSLIGSGESAATVLSRPLVVPAVPSGRHLQPGGRPAFGCTLPFAYSRMRRGFDKHPSHFSPR